MPFARLKSKKKEENMVAKIDKEYGLYKDDLSALRKSEAKPEVVVITGASAGVGRATVREFAKRGAYIGLIARGRDGLEGAQRDVEELGGKALVLPLDVADQKEIEREIGRAHV